MRKLIFIHILITVLALVVINNLWSINKAIQVQPILKSPEPKSSATVPVKRETEFSRFSNDKFSFEYPTNWKVTTFEEGVDIASPDNQYTSPETGFPIHKSGSSLIVSFSKTEFSDYQQKFAEDNMMQAVADNVKKSMFRGYPAISYELHMNGNSSEQISLIKDSTLYGLIFHYSSQSLDRDEVYYQHLLKTFEFTD